MSVTLSRDCALAEATTIAVTMAAAMQALSELPTFIILLL
jgi:hypothetical protein